MLRVMLANNHAVIRKGIEQLLADDSRIEMLGAAFECSEAIAKVRKFRPDVLILDVHMPLEPGLSNSDFGAQINSCGTKVLGISLAYDDDARALATTMGAAEALDKVKLSQELIPTLMKLASVENSASPTVHTPSSAIGREL